MMFTHRLLNNLIMDVQHPQHAGFVGSHLATEADDVGKHDSRQPPSLHVHRTADVVLHRPDYSADITLLSTVHGLRPNVNELSCRGQNAVARTWQPRYRAVVNLSEELGRRGHNAHRMTR